MISGEISGARKEQGGHPPTTLHLFHFSQAESSNLQPRVNSVEQFVNSAKGALESLDELQTTVNKRTDRLLTTYTELTLQTENLKSSATCGAIFLKMSDELPHLSSKELTDFFKLCLGINDQLYDPSLVSSFFDPEQLTKVRTKLVTMSYNQKALIAKLTALIPRMDGDPPQWFNGGKKSWDQFVWLHAVFVPYLNPDIKTIEVAFKKEKTENSDSILLGAVLPGEYPDWVLDNETIPTKDIVQKEFDEDMNDARKSYAEKEKTKKQGTYIQDQASQKFKKTKSWFDEQRQKLLLKGKGFTDYVLRLHARDKMWESINQKESKLEPDESPEGIIKEFSESKDLAANPEVVALFLERSLRESGIIDTAAHPVDDRITNLFNQLFESMQAKDKEDPSLMQFHRLKETNRKVFESLNYDMKPFLELSTPDEISYLHELLETYKGYPIETFIWDLAETASSHFNKDESEEKEKLKSKVAHSLSQPTASFLRNSWKWAYDQLKESLSTKRNVQLPSPTPPLTTDEVKPSSPSPIADVEEIESSIQELQEGNLSGWQIFYTTNRTTDPKHLIKIPGTTLDEREEELEGFFQTEGIHPSIKISSIINAFDHLQVTPEEWEWIRMRKEVNGEVFKKIKRGKGRLFYVMDPDKKELVFFYEQKKAWSYAF